MGFVTRRLVALVALVAAAVGACSAGAAAQDAAPDTEAPAVGATSDANEAEATGADAEPEGTASAADSPESSDDAEERRGAFELSTVLGEAEGADAFSQRFTVTAAMSEQLLLTGGFGWAYAASTRGDAQGFRAGNPHVGLLGSFGEVLVSAPVASRPAAEADAPDATRLALRGAMAMRGGRDAWAWMPDRMALAYRAPRFRVQLEPTDWLAFALELEGAAALVVGTSSEAPRLGLLLDVAPTLAVELGPARLGITYRYALDSAGDAWSTFEPSVGLRLGPVEVRLFAVGSTHEDDELGGAVLGLDLTAGF